MTTPFQVNRLCIADEPAQLHQASNDHIGIVRDLKDPNGRGRVRVEVRSLWSHGDGAKNWSKWCEMARFPVGASRGDGDCGIWWCPLPGELVKVSFLGGDYKVPVVEPFSAWQADVGPKKAIIPLDAKAVGDRNIRKGTRVRVFKTEAGHTWLADDNGMDEAMFLVDWTGAGAFWMAPGKKLDEQEQKDQESAPRKGETRGTNLVMAQSSKTPSELVNGGRAVSGFLDLNGQGFFCVAEDGKGVVTLFATKKNGEVGPSLILDADQNRIAITADVIVFNAKDKIRTTRQIIKELIYQDMSDFFKSMYQALASRFSRFSAEPSEPQQEPDPKVIVA